MWSGPPVPALADLLDELRVERGKVVWSAAGDKALIHDHLLIHPGGARIAQIRCQAGVTGEGAAVDDTGLDEDPGAVADHADRLVLVEEGAREGDRRLVESQGIPVGHAAGQHQRVEIVGRAAVRRLVDGLHMAVLSGDLGSFRRDHRRGRAGLGHRIPGADEFAVLEAVRREERHAVFTELGHHPSFRRKRSRRVRLHGDVAEGRTSIQRGGQRRAMVLSPSRRCRGLSGDSSECRFE